MRFVQLPSFTMMGIEARTSFRREKAPGGVLPEVWERVRRGALSTIPHRADGDMIALYTEYESDEYGEYTFVLGARVTSTSVVPAGMVVKEVAAARYAVFESERGTPHVIINTWKRIWNEPRTDEYRRAYLADFEVYDLKGLGPDECQASIYIGVK